MFLEFVPREAKIIKGKSSIDFTEYHLFTYSRDAIYKIAQHIGLEEEHEVLVPDYICNSVINTLYEFTKNITLYKIDERLNFDEDEIKSLIKTNTKMVIFVDYFGVETEVKPALTELLKKQNITILKDAAHSFLTLVKNGFQSKYEYDYLVSSIYKNLHLHAGAIAIGKFDTRKDFISSNIIIKRKQVTLIKKVLCFFGISFINRGIENLRILDEKYSFCDGDNIAYEYTELLNSIDYNLIIQNRDKVAKEFYSYFSKNSLFNKEQIEKSSLQVFPLLCSSKKSRDDMIKFFRNRCVDAFTWPTFHKNAINEELWSKIILLPLDIKVLELAKKRGK